MYFDVRISNLERKQLESLIGHQLVAVATDYWSIYIFTDVLDICIIPEEIPTPDDAHPNADVTRPKVTESVNGEYETLALDLGTITSVTVLTTVATFSQPKLRPPLKIGSATIPEGIQYGLIFSHPSDRSHFNPINSIIDLDIGFEIDTDTENRIIIYTDGCGFFTHVALNEKKIAEEILERTQLLTV